MSQGTSLSQNVSLDTSFIEAIVENDVKIKQNIYIIITDNSILENTFQNNYHFKSILLLLTPPDDEIQLLPVIVV